MALGDLAAFSAATIERGRLRGRSAVWEVGRLCQLRGEFLDGIALDGEAFIRFKAGSTFSRSASEEGNLPFEGDAGDPIKRSIASSVAMSRRLSSFGVSIRREASDKLLGCVADILEFVGVFEGEDLVGEIDRARSGI